MNRRLFLSMAGLVGGSLAGCLGQGAAPEQPTATDSPTPSPTTGSQVEVPPCPEKPNPITRDTVLQFATQFEKAFVTRNVLREHERVVSVDIDIGRSPTSKTATQTDGGSVARFNVNGPAYRYRPNPESTETAHYDPPLYVANYLVTDQTVVRAKAAKEVDPREHGTEVTCPPQ